MHIQRFGSVKQCKPCDVLEHLGNFDGIVPSLVCILMKQHGIHGGKCLLKTPGNAISVTQNFKMSLAASTLKNLCFWCEFQSCLLFIISLLLKNFLTALVNLSFHTGLPKNAVLKYVHLAILLLVNVVFSF